MADISVDTTTPLRFVVPEDYYSVANGEVTLALTSFAGGAGSFTTLAASGATSLATTLAVAGTSTLAAVNMTGTLAVTGAATISTTLGVTGATTLAAASATALTASTSLTVTGANIVGLTEAFTLNVESLEAGFSWVYYVVAPFSGTIVRIDSVLHAAITGADATLQAQIGGVSVTNGLIKIAEAGSAAGVVDTCAPSALNTLVAGSSVLSFVVGGGSTAPTGATLTIVMRRSA